MIKRINLISGPGSGKSTLASYLFYRFKELHYKCEYVNEYIKGLCYDGIQPKSFDQIYILAKQLHKEDIFLRNGVDFVITDSPLWLQCFYASLSNDRTLDAQITIAKEFEFKYPSLNIFLDRSGIEYKSEGRYQSSLEEAKSVDDKLLKFLHKNKIYYLTLPAIGKETIFGAIKERLNR